MKNMSHAIICKLKELKPILKERYGIEEFSVFGSVAKGTDTEKSDVDIAVLKLNLKDAFALYDFMAWDSVIREFEIIGEASKCLIRDKLIETNHRRIVDFRNQISHEYFGIDQEIVWGIIQQKLRAFETDITELISNIKSDLKKELIESFIEDNHYLDFVVVSLKKLSKC